MKKYLLFLLFFWFLAGFLFSQQSTKLNIDYWLRNYNQVTQGQTYEYAQSIFKNVVAVADKPVGILPSLYVFSDLEPYQIFATKDGGIVLPGSIIQFCNSDKIHGSAQLAFLLSHEIKHIVRGDYELREMLMKFIEELDSNEDSNFIKQVTLSPELNRLKAMEIQADQYGILYAALAGYDIESVYSAENNFITKFYEFVGFDPYGDLSNPSVSERDRAIKQKVNKIIEYLELYDFGLKLYAIGEYDAAIDLFTKFLSQFPSREVYNNRGLCYYQKAYYLYSEWNPSVLNENPNYLFKLSPQIECISRAEISTRSIHQNFEKKVLQYLNQAITDFKEAERLDNQYPVVYNNLGCVYLLKGDLGFAKDYFKSAKNIDTNYKEAFNNLAICYIAEGNGKTAESTFLEVNRLFPAYPDPVFNLGQLFAITNNKKKAKKYFNKYLLLENNNIYANKAKDYLNIKSTGKSESDFFENIAGTKPGNWKTEINKWKNFQTPEGNIYIHLNKKKKIKSLHYVDNNDYKNISILGTAKGYPGKTFNSVRISDSIELIKKNYPFPKKEIPTSLGTLWIYKELGLAFDIRKNKVHEWFLYNID
jgi:tetratricopeptide (TPR) repeat protein